MAIDTIIIKLQTYAFKLTYLGFPAFSLIISTFFLMFFWNISGLTFEDSAITFIFFLNKECKSSKIP